MGYRGKQSSDVGSHFLSTSYSAAGNRVGRSSYAVSYTEPGSGNLLCLKEASVTRAYMTGFYDQHNSLAVKIMNKKKLWYLSIRISKK